MGRGEEVQRDVGCEDLLWEGRLEERREPFLEDAQSWEARVSVSRSVAFCRMGLGLFWAHFCLILPFDHLGVCLGPGPGVAWYLHREKSG